MKIRWWASNSSLGIASTRIRGQRIIEGLQKKALMPTGTH